MPRCEGRPDGPCPGRVNNASVKLSQGDLMLCKECDLFRFPPAAAAANDSSNVSYVPATGVDDKKPDTERKLIVCEVRCFLDNKFDNFPISVLKSAICNFYREDGIVSAKQILIQAIDSSHHSSLNTYLRKRIGDSRVERTSDDILCIFKYADENNLRNHLPLFCDATLARVPDVPDEMPDLTSVRNNVNTILNQLQSLTECVSSIKPVTSEINEVSIQTRILLHIPQTAPAVIQPQSAYDNSATHDTHIYA